MSKLVERILKQLEKPESYEDFQEALGYAGDIFSSYKMNGFTSEIYPEIGKEKYSKDDIENLKEILLHRLHEKPHSDYAGTILWALGKLRDSSLKEIYITYLIMYLRESINYDFKLNQVEIALSDIGEKIITGSSQGVYDFDKNVKQAMDYLKKIGKFDLVHEQWDECDR